MCLEVSQTFWQNIFWDMAIERAKLWLIAEGVRGVYILVLTHPGGSGYWYDSWSVVVVCGERLTTIQYRCPKGQQTLPNNMSWLVVIGTTMLVLGVRVPPLHRWPPAGRLSATSPTCLMPLSCAIFLCNLPFLFCNLNQISATQLSAWFSFTAILFLTRRLISIPI